MSSTVQTVLTLLQYDILEDNGLVLGLLTADEFIDLFNLTISDFLTRTALVRRIYTQSIVAGVPTYSIPDDIARVSYAFVAGRYIGRESQASLNTISRGWRRKQGIPAYYYEDGLPLKTIGLALCPSYNGSTIIGPNEPSPPNAIYDSFSALCVTPSGNVMETPVQHRGLTIIGPRLPEPVTALSDPIPLLADDWSLSFLGFGILQRIFEGDNELQDDAKAAYSKAQFEEGVALGRLISGEPQE